MAVARVLWALVSLAALVYILISSEAPGWAKAL